MFAGQPGRGSIFHDRFLLVVVDPSIHFMEKRGTNRIVDLCCADYHNADLLSCMLGIPASAQHRERVYSVQNSS